MKKIFCKIAVAALVAGPCLGLVSCSDDLNLKPKNDYIPETFWKTKEEYQGFIIAMSQMFRANYPQQILFSAGEMRAGSLGLVTIDGSGIANPNEIQNLYTQTDCQFSTFGGWYGFIGNLNEFIYRIDQQAQLETPYLDENTANGLEAIAYGWRAFAYFQMYRMYGGVPLRLEPDVILGEYNPEKLYMARATAEQTLAQIKSDIDKSLQLFSNSTYVYNSKKDYYWSKAATELLAGQVYLWSGKVSTGDHAANGADVAIAKGYFDNVIKNYGFALQKDFYNIWLVPQNKESIYSICYSSMDDKVWYGMQTNFNWSRVTGAAGAYYWSTMDDSSWDKLTDGHAYRFGRWATKGADGKITERTSKIWDRSSYGVQRYMYKNALFFQFDENDQRGDAFYPQYFRSAQEVAAGTVMLENFNPENYKIAGTFILKFRPSTVEGYTYQQFKVDMPIYRLPDAILGMAECCNYEGDNAGVEKYINMLRERAYGDDWDVATYGYTAGSFKDNEVAILHESDKEFYLEGRRWWDLRRLTINKGGAQTDHLVFQPEGCIGWGLPVDSSPWMIENDGTPCKTAEPVLPTTWEYRLLWPIDATLLGSDPLVEQNPGY